MVRIELPLKSPPPRSIAFKVPLCAACQEHWHAPLFRIRNHIPARVAVVLSVLLIAIGVIFAPFFIAAIIMWYVRVLLIDHESNKMREGNHAIHHFSTSTDVVAKEIVTIAESCEISVAVTACETPVGMVFGFGNSHYATEFKTLNETYDI